MQKKVFGEDEGWIENNEEYYYAVGQMAAYLISLSKSKNRNQSLINPFLNARKNEVIKLKLRQLYKKYNYTIPVGIKRIGRMMSLIEEYIPSGDVDQDMIIFGFLNENIIYMKEEKQS